MNYQLARLYTDDTYCYVGLLKRYVDAFMRPDYHPKSFEWSIAKRAANALLMYDNAIHRTTFRPVDIESKSPHSPIDDDPFGPEYYHKTYVAIRTTSAQILSKRLMR